MLIGKKNASGLVFDSRTGTVKDGMWLAGLARHGRCKEVTGLLQQDRSIGCAILRRKVRLKGTMKLLLAFGRCFPSLSRELVERPLQWIERVLASWALIGFNKHWFNRSVLLKAKYHDRKPQTTRAKFSDARRSRG